MNACRWSGMIIMDDIIVAGQVSCRSIRLWVLAK